MTDRRRDRAPRIVAVVVTFNRLGLLQRLVARLREVPELDEILVVDNASTDGTGEWLAAADDRRAAVHAPHPRPTTAAAPAASTTGCAWAVERGADLVWLMDDDGLPDPDCLDHAARARATTSTSGARSWSTRTTRTGWCFPIRLPGGTRVVHADGRRRARPRRRRDPRRRDPVQRRAGHPRARRADRPARARSSSSGATTTSTACAPSEAGARIATVVDARVLPPQRRRPRHADDVRPDDVQPHPERPQALLHGPQQPGQPARVPRLAARAGVRRQDRCGSTRFTRPTPARLRLSARAMRAGLRGDFTGHRRFLA